MAELKRRIQSSPDVKRTHVFSVCPLGRQTHFKPVSTQWPRRYRQGNELVRGASNQSIQHVSHAQFPRYGQIDILTIFQNILVI